MIYPRPFVPPTKLYDSPEARLKAKREALVILRKMVRYFGLKEVKGLLTDIAKKQRGNKPNKSLDALLVAAYDAAVAKAPETTRTEVAKDFCKKYRQQSVRATEKRLTRALQDRERKAEQERRLKALQRPTLIGTIGTR
jgi:hypothetical protein